MSAKLIKGKEIAEQIRAEIKQGVEQLRAQKGLTPGLVTILVGEDPASQSYVVPSSRRPKSWAFIPARIRCRRRSPKRSCWHGSPATTRTRRSTAFWCSCPCPGTLTKGRVLYALDPNKDVDAFHPVNVGRMVIGEPGFLPCTPYGIQQMLVRSGVKTDGAEVVVVGRSNIVGKPIANILLQKAPGRTRR